MSADGVDTTSDGSAVRLEPGAGEELVDRARRDRVLDTIRSVALVRVVLWHTWSWAWLTWIPAMPAMFFTTGALLEGSLVRRGWRATVTQRFRRLLIPYWLYAATACAVMFADGWRPDLGEALRWVVPLLDPVGSDDLAGLWVPLWYVRAYLWFVLGAGVLGAAARRLGSWAIVASTVIAVAAWWWARAGNDVPFAVGDLVAYSPFVLAGMLYTGGRRLPSALALVALGVSSGLAAIATWQRFGPDDGVVNRSYLLTMLVGAAGLAVVLAFRSRISSIDGTAATVVDRLNTNALSIYLWQGFGLVAAQRLVDLRMDPGPVRAVVSLGVVVVVIAGCVAVVAPLEDFAARREVRRPGRAALMAPVALGLVVTAMVLPLPDGAVPEAPLSGRAVVERAGIVESQLSQGPNQVVTPTVPAGTPPRAVLDEWVAEHAELLETIDAGWIEATVVGPSGATTVGWAAEGAQVPTTPLSWWSMTKAVTASWFAALVDDGVVELSTPLSTYVPEVPRADDITLEQLARHTAGIPAEVDADLFETTPRGDIDRFIDYGRLAYEPGEGYQYSRTGFFLLALALERASGTTWQDAVGEMSERAGVPLRFDDDPEVAPQLDLSGPPTDPDGHGYHGALWSSGGLVSSTEEAATFLGWLFSDGLSPDAVGAMTRFSSDPEKNYYGLGLAPLCPCEPDGDDAIRSERFGIDSATGTFGVDAATGSVVMIRAGSWWDGEAPARDFYDLQQLLLDSAA